MNRHRIGSSLVIWIALVGCDARQPDAAPSKGQTAEEAAELLCSSVKKIEAESGNLAAVAEDLGDRLTHPGVRGALEQLATEGSGEPDPFFASMEEVLGHEWNCPAMRTMFSPAE